MKFCKSNQQDIVLAIAVFLITLISFNVGRIYGTANLKNSIIVNKINKPLDAASDQKKGATSQPLDLRVVASKNSTSKLYHFLWCSGAQKIKESNKIYFSSDQEAQSRGYALAGNCRK